MGSRSTFYKTKEEMIKELLSTIASMDEKELVDTYNQLMSSEISWYEIGEEDEEK